MFTHPSLSISSFLLRLAQAKARLELLKSGAQELSTAAAWQRQFLEAENMWGNFSQRL